MPSKEDNTASPTFGLLFIAGKINLFATGYKGITLYAFEKISFRLPCIAASVDERIHKKNAISGVPPYIAFPDSNISYSGMSLGSS